MEIIKLSVTMIFAQIVSVIAIIFVAFRRVSIWQVVFDTLATVISTVLFTVTNTTLVEFKRSKKLVSGDCDNFFFVSFSTLIFIGLLNLHPTLEEPQ